MEPKWQVVQRSKSHVTLHEQKIVIVLWVCIFVFFGWEAREFHFSYHKLDKINLWLWPFPKQNCSD